MKPDIAPWHDLSQRLQQRDEQQLLRQRRVVASPQGVRIVVDGRELWNFCGNDYLGLANDERLKAAASAAIAQWGVGSGASHLVCGHQVPHETLEKQAAEWLGFPAALSLCTGYMANLAVVSGLMGRGDAVFADKLNHASLNDACLLSRADFQRYPHNDMAALERQLAASSAAHKMIVSDAVFSMDGDIAPLAELLALAERYNAWLFLDDAHGFGVLGGGRGSLVHFDIPASPYIIYLATLGKAAGSAGAIVAAQRCVIDWLVNNARSYIYTTAAPAAIAAASCAALSAIADDQWRRQQLNENISLLRDTLSAAGLPLLLSTTAIQPIIMPSNQAALDVSQALRDYGFWVAAIRPPTVPTPRLRITLSAMHQPEQIGELCCVLARLAATIG